MINMTDYDYYRIERNKQETNELILGPRMRINNALQIISQYGGIDGGHHKQWVLDQVVRILADDYEEWVKIPKGWDEKENDYMYDWDEGIAP